jgi:GH25 family lysozyme M1 (1,4-beta-N-acetylmuramidase)
MLNFIDISSWQGDIDLSPLPIDAVIVKATEGTNYVNPRCDPKIQQAISLSLPYGFYHYAKDYDPIAEADYFVDNCLGYFTYGIPVLDWEEGQSVDWVNSFVRRVHDRVGVWPWIYANPWRINQGGVEPNCGRWIADYPNLLHPGFEYNPDYEGYVDGLMCAWQYCSDGRIAGYDGDLGLNHFYGDRDAWNSYANPVLVGAYDSPDGEKQDDIKEDAGCCACCKCKG